MATRPKVFALCLTWIVAASAWAAPPNAAATHAARARIEELRRQVDTHTRSKLPGLPEGMSPARLLRQAAAVASQGGARIAPRGGVEGPTWRLDVSEPSTKAPFWRVTLDREAGVAGYHKIAWGPVRQGVVLQRSNFTPYGRGARLLTRTLYPLEAAGLFAEKVDFSSRRTAQSPNGETEHLTSAVRYYLREAGRRTPISLDAFRQKLQSARELVTQFDGNLVHRPLQPAVP
jgi:hypothetical protein